MDETSLGLCNSIVPSSYVNQGNQSLITQSNLIKLLLEKVSVLPGFIMSNIMHIAEAQCHL